MRSVFYYLITGASLIVLLVFWFADAYRMLAKKRADMLRAQEQLKLHQEGYEQVRGGPNAQTAKRMVETSSTICLHIQNSYNETLAKPMYRLPGILMGFTSAEDQTQFESMNDFNGGKK